MYLLFLLDSWKTYELLKIFILEGGIIPGPLVIKHFMSVIYEFS